MQLNNTTSIQLLESIHSELIDNCFEPVDDTLNKWRGPISKPFRTLTTAKSMEIEFRDGWPYRHPRILVGGLRREHVNNVGEVCLWAESNSSMEWCSFSGIESRIKRWCEKANSQFTEADRSLDAHLYYENAIPNLGLIDFEQFIDKYTRDGYIQKIFGTPDKYNNLNINKESNTGDVTGILYYLSNIDTPPSNIYTFRDCLNPVQKRNFRKIIKEIEKNNRNAKNFVILIWPSGSYYNALCLHLKLVNKKVLASAMIIAPNNSKIISMRAGKNYNIFLKQDIVLFGIGSVGSHLGYLLVKAGLGKIRLIDGGLLRPGNIIRHFCSYEYKSRKKVEAFAETIKHHTSWTEITKYGTDKWSNEDIHDVCKNSSLIIDATGNSAFSMHLSSIAYYYSFKLLQLALYRGGTVGRIRYQNKQEEWPIYSRRSSSSIFPIIPPTENNYIGLETGCSSPVNNAPLSSIVKVSSSAVQLVSKIISGSIINNQDTIEQYDNVDEPPLFKIGTKNFSVL